jgi:hypothetical protein
MMKFSFQSFAQVFFCKKETVLADYPKRDEREKRLVRKGN